jgi:2-polyprenyl-6-methoxyphenol hydroxylase-like FAD-dependent oxidoreductase
MRNGQEHAVVLGASLAGLLAARVLSDHYQRVTLIERDMLPAAAEHRKGVPHGRHVHGLHPRGREILDELFPGFTDATAASGGVVCDVLADIRMQLSGHQLRQERQNLPTLFASRPFLEDRIRARVRALPNVRVLEGCTVTGLTAAQDRRRITGVRLDGPAGTPRAVEADLVADATGRGSRTPARLTELGYQAPAEERIEVRLGYTTRHYRLRPGALGGDITVLTQAIPANPRAGVIAAIEGGRHVVTLAGILGDYPPTDPAGFDAFAASLPFPDISAAIAGAEPLDDPVPFRFPANTRMRYERLRDLPAGLIVIGDAVCSFNPIYAQGMTVAAMEALALRRLLAAGAAGNPRRYFKAIARTADVPWDIAVGADLAFPGVCGKRTAKVRLVNAYLPRVCAAAEEDGVLAGSVMRVLGLKDRPEGLLRPDRALRVLRGNLRRPAVRAEVPDIAPADIPPSVTA